MIKLGIVYGGVSTEHDISVMSAKSVIENLDKEKYEKPILFDYLNTLKRKYIYINSKMVIKEAIKNKKDVYFYDDTHWSPIASELIASEILRICI